MKNIRKKIMEHEGIRLFPYRCTADKITIGVGRNLSDRGITFQEAEFLLDNDILNSINELNRFDWFKELNSCRGEVMIELHFNIGLPALLTFKRMIAAIKEKNYKLAAAELLDSKWFHDVGATRANDMANRLLTGNYEV